MADFNDDSIIDRAVLGVIHPNLCSLIIQYGTAPGVFLPPIAYTYQRPGVDVGTNCPDIGTAFDGDNDRFDELARLERHHHRHHLQPDRDRPGLHHHHHVHLAATDPDLPRHPGLHRQRRRLALLHQPGGYYTSMIVDGVAVPGLAQWCSANAPAFQHADFDRDRRADVVLAYTDGCTDHGNGVVVLLATGERRQLEIDLSAQATWRTQISNFDSDRFLDVRTQNLLTGVVNYYHGVGDGNFVEGPRANSDRVQLTSVKPVAIDVLANDYASSRSAW